MVIGQWLLVNGYWSMVIGQWLLAGCEFRKKKLSWPLYV
jgi:hypothetical protein